MNLTEEFLNFVCMASLSHNPLKVDWLVSSHQNQPDMTTITSLLLTAFNRKDLLKYTKKYICSLASPWYIFSMISWFPFLADRWFHLRWTLLYSCLLQLVVFISLNPVYLSKVSRIQSPNRRSPVTTWNDPRSLKTYGQHGFLGCLYEAPKKW